MVAADAYPIRARRISPALESQAEEYTQGQHYQHRRGQPQAGHIGLLPPAQPLPLEPQSPPGQQDRPQQHGEKKQGFVRLFQLLAHQTTPLFHIVSQRCGKGEQTGRDGKAVPACFIRIWPRQTRGR